ncbi:MAG: alpha/beta fold hydrolase [Saprospirales bacterium]|nr:alpha/beta fold hydrolase [Saprospirales bacterium]
MKFLLLPGALGSATHFDPLLPLLPADWQAHAFSFSGHGGKPFGPAFSNDAFVEEVVAEMDRLGWDRCDFFGYSMGGYVALSLALKYPARVNRIMTLGTKLLWSPEIAQKEAGMLDPEKIEAKVPAFAQALAERHAPGDWKELCRKTAGLMQQLGATNPLDPANLMPLAHAVRICLGDADNMVSKEESLAVVEALANGEFRLLENTPHPLEKVDKGVLAKEMRAYFSQ